MGSPQLARFKAATLLYLEIHEAASPSPPSTSSIQHDPLI